MKYGVFSDIEGDVEGTIRTIKSLQDLGAYRMNFLGDVLGNGKRSDEKRCLMLLRKCNVCCNSGEKDSKGNFIPDAKYDSKGYYFMHSLSRGLETQITRELFSENVEKFRKHPGTKEDLLLRIVFFGHTRKPQVFYKNFAGKVGELPIEELLKADKVSLDMGFIYGINPGSVAKLHNGSGTYLLFDSDKYEISFYSLRAEYQTSQH